jgi:hypothetical protein
VHHVHNVHRPLSSLSSSFPCDDAGSFPITFEIPWAKGRCNQHGVVNFKVQQRSEADENANRRGNCHPPSRVAEVSFVQQGFTALFFDIPGLFDFSGVD